MKNREYYFIRHALPLNDAASFHLSVFDQDMQGNIDEALSDEGKMQAAALYETIRSLGIEHIISSTRKRAVETAAIISEKTKIHYNQCFKSLNEVNLGTPYKNSRNLSKMILSNALSALQKSPIPRTIKKKVDYGLASSLLIYYFLKWNQGQTSGGDLMTDISSNIKKMLHILDQFSENRIAIVCHAGWISFLTVHILGGARFEIKRSRSPSLSRSPLTGPIECPKAPVTIAPLTPDMSAWSVKPVF